MDPAPERRRPTVGVTADRRRDDQAVLLRRFGLEVVLGPMVQTLPFTDADGLRERTADLIAHPPDYLIANTGFGMRAWMAAATAWGMDGELRTALGRGRVAARGPKAAGALSQAGLALWWRSPSEQLADVTAHLLAEGVAGRRVAFQRQGEDRPDLVEALEAAGAEVVEIPVYHWAMPDDVQAGRRLIELCCQGGIDAVTFTAGPAVRNMLELADSDGRAGELLDALNGGVLVGCIGPVCAAVAEEEGISHPLVPPHWRLGSLVRAVAGALAERPAV